MIHRIILVLFASAILASSGCAVSPQFESVPPGKTYGGSYINITAPKSENWKLVQSSPAGMAFARRASEEGESFVASVAIFNLPETTSPEGFEELIVEQAGRDLETSRFTTSEFTHSYTEARGYPCVETHNISKDKKAQTGGGNTSTLILENYHLYCRHPVRTNTGFDIAYSHRGTSRHPNLRSEAQAFIQGVQVPNANPNR